MLKRTLLVLLVLTAFVSTAFAAAPAKFSASPSKKIIKSGEKFLIRLTVDVNKKYYTYSIKEQLNKEGLGPTPTEIKVEPKSLVDQKGKVIEPKPHSKMDKGFEMNILYHTGKLNFTIPVVAKKDLNLDKEKLTVLTYIQFCDSISCLPPEEYKTTVSGKEFQLSEEETKLLGANETETAAVTETVNTQEVKTSETKKSIESKPAMTESQSEIEQKKKEGIWSFLWFAMMMGALSLLTPCVFPMVPITVSFFTKRAEKNKSNGLKDSIIYALGIIITFTGIGIIVAVAAGPTGIRDFAASGWTNILIAAVFVIFALNLFGAFEIQIPTSLLNKLNAKSDEKGGIIGVLLMGLTFSLTSFTCTVPFVGSALISASSGDWFYPIVGMLGFSAVFAAPFFLLALFPSYMNKLPKAGGWMNNIKVVMGFLEIAAAIKFISNADLVWNWGIMPKEMFLAIWIACAILIFLYILGFFRLGHDAPINGIGTPRVVFAIVFGTIVFYLFTGLFGKPLGELDAFLPPAEYHEIMSAGNNADAGITTTPVSNPSNVKPSGEEAWLKNYDEALAEAKKQNKPLLVDFTGFTCTNCRWMEQNMFKKPAVVERLDKYIKVKLYTDRNKEPYISNKKLQESKFGSIELPLYVVMDSNGNLIRTNTFTRDEAAFIQFLDSGLK